MSAWENMHGETLRLEWEEGLPVLYHSDFDDVPVVIDVRVVGFRRDEVSEDEKPRGLVLFMRRVTGDIILSDEEQKWLLGELVRHEL